MQVVAFAAGLLLILTASCCAEIANFTCYSLTSLEAKNIQKVYDDNQESGVFWSRNGSGLDLCDFSSIYSTPQCSVCNDSGTIIVVLYNLTISVKLMVEGPDRPISYNKTDCPRPTTPAGSNRAASPKPANVPPEADGRHRYVLIGPLTLASIVIFILALYKPCNNRSEAADGS